MPVLGYNIKLLSLSGLWPRDEDDWKMVCLRWFEVIMCLLSGVPSSIAVIHQIYIGSLDEEIFTDNPIGLGNYFGCMFIYICFVKNAKKLQNILKRSDMFLDYCPRKLMEETEQGVETFTKWFMVYLTTGIILYGTIPLIEYKECKFSRIDRIHDPCGFPIRIYIPYDTTQPLVYALLFLHIQLGSYYICEVVLLVTITMIGLLMHINSQVGNLKQMVTDIFTDSSYIEDDNLTIAQIKKCARYHQLIIDYTSDVFECFTTLLIVHVSLASIVLAFLSFQIVHASDTSEKIRHLVHLGGWMALLFATCYYGQQIVEESSTFGDIIFQSAWYRSAPEARRYLCFMILRSQRPVKLRAAYICDISLQAFVSIIKTAYSYFTLLLYIAN